MRAIKFRATSKASGKSFMVDKIVFGNPITVYGGGEVYPINDVDLEQFTGLTDKDGVDIYEGDIVEAQYGALTILQMRVTWSRAGWYLEDGTVYHEPTWWKPPKQNQDCKVIGNIHEDDHNN